jgi:hypothetical protein
LAIHSELLHHTRTNTLQFWVMYKTADVFNPVRERALRQQNLGWAPQLAAGQAAASWASHTAATSARTSNAFSRLVQQAAGRGSSSGGNAGEKGDKKAQRGGSKHSKRQSGGGGSTAAGEPTTAQRWAGVRGHVLNLVVDGKLQLGPTAQVPHPTLVPPAATTPQPRTTGLSGEFTGEMRA